jgi:hypothetical protein
MSSVSFTKTHEDDLAEIAALARGVDERAKECLGELEGIEAAQRKALGRGAYPPLIAFVHIPKTAGAAVVTMFVAAYSRRGTHDTGNYVSGPEKVMRKVARRPGGWERLQRQGVRVAVGHTPFGMYWGNIPSDTRYITFLREPVDRVLSHYYRHIHLPGMSDAERGTRAKRAGSLEEALVDMRLPQLRNLCTRFLCSHPTMEDLPYSAVEEAKENLRRFAFVGIQERFDESIVLLQRKLGLGLLPYQRRHVSGTTNRPSIDAISDRERAVIEEHNQLDSELYAFGLELFEEAITGADEGLEADVELLRAAAEGAREEHQSAVEAARAWLDQELPAGSKEPTRSVISRAEAAGLSRAALTEARKELLVHRAEDGDGTRSFARPSGASLSAVEDAKTWLDRELPAGATELRTALIERGEAAGHTPQALNRAKKLLSANKVRGDDGQWVWARPARVR